jgi:3-oxoacyl-[acyl-carrier protein] reductase
MKLKGQVALVTGGAQGIGKSICIELAKEGADIIVSDINLEAATATAQELEKLGVKASPLKMNVASSPEVDAAIKRAAADYGKIDILINNAGITRDGLIMRMKEEDWDLVLNVNLKSIFNTTKAVSSIMMKQRSGRIVNIASIVGEMGNAGQANYSASKGGAIALTKTSARELASRGITVNAIAPGFIDTDMTKKLPEEVKDKLKAQIPMAKLGLPEDVAKAVVFLCADAPYITGQVINVNGGMYM